MYEEFAFYVDESGSPKPSPKDSANYFAVGGVLIRRKNENLIKKKVSDFKIRWNIAESVPLHGSEIRSRKKQFAWLGRLPKETQEKFFNDLTDTIISCPLLVHGCVVSRQGYLDRYLEKYGTDTWEMMKSAFSILLERVSKYVSSKDGKVMVFFEKAGKKEDRMMKNYFNMLKQEGTPFKGDGRYQYDPLACDQFKHVLSGIEGKPKSSLVLQIADLCLYPIAKSKDAPENRAFRALVEHQKLVDSNLNQEQLKQVGIKYYCFD